MPILAPHRYVLWLLAAATLCLGLVAWLCWWVDPYALRDSASAKVRWQIIEQARLRKPHDIDRLRPDTLLCGTSRVEQALEPAHPGFAAAGLSPYNAALPGSSLYEQRRLIEHAQALHPLKRVILELDFFMFTAKHRRIFTGFTEQRLAVSPDLRPQPFFRFTDLATTFASVDALDATWRTLRAPESRRLTMARIGDRGHLRLIPEDRGEVTTRVCFHVNLNHLLSSYYLDTELAGKDGTWLPRDDLAAIIARCRRDGIALTLFFPPEHAFLAWGEWICGQRPTAETIRRTVVELAGDDVPVWDFSAIAGPTAVALPAGDESLPDYHDAGHYTPRMGRRILDVIFAGAPVDGFGVRLRADNLDQVFARQREFLQTWAAANPGDAAEVRSLVADRLPAPR